MTENDFNTLTHYLVPEHTLLSKDEATAVLEELKIKPEQLPRIKQSDAALQALEKTLGEDKIKEVLGPESEGKIVAGSIIKITRNSSTAEVFVTYRLVTEAKS